MKLLIRQQICLQIEGVDGHEQTYPKKKNFNHRAKRGGSLFQGGSGKEEGSRSDSLLGGGEGEGSQSDPTPVRWFSLAKLP